MSHLKAGCGGSQMGTCLLCKSCGEATDKPVEKPVQDSECPLQKPVSVHSLIQHMSVRASVCPSTVPGAGDTRVLNLQPLWDQRLLKERDTEVIAR